MTLVSYAQNGEDVVLYRALKDIEKGHYIDVGACDPQEHSVTKAFYDLGWQGVNVEPSNMHFARLEAERERDININAAVGARSGRLTFHHIPETGLSTLVSDVASAARDKGFAAETIDVPVLTLADICRTLPFSTTHFLKIDVEGGERDVLLGADFATFRPWIIVIEATAPLSALRTDHEWRRIIEAADYDCVLFDGLNLYFLAREHAELRDRLVAPANVLDDFIPASVLAAQQREAALNARIGERDAIIASQTAERTRTDALQEERDRLSLEVSRLDARLSSLHDELIRAGDLSQRLRGYYNITSHLFELRQKALQAELARSATLAEHRSANSEHHLASLLAAIRLHRDGGEGDVRRLIYWNELRKRRINDLEQRLLDEGSKRQDVEFKFKSLRGDGLWRLLATYRRLMGRPALPNFERSSQHSEVERILDTGLFDTEFYRAENPDVVAMGLDPVQHFASTGCEEGRKPNADFDPAFYRSMYADVGATGAAPLIHFSESGLGERRLPAPPPDQDQRAYAGSLASLTQAERDEVAQVAATGMFDAKYYLEYNSDVAESAAEPIVHFATVGWAEGRRPNANFDPAFYLDEYEDVRESGINPLVHYATSGLLEGRLPEPFPVSDDRMPGASSADTDPRAGEVLSTGLFDEQYYQVHNPDLAQSGISLPLHFALHGWREGRRPNPYFDPAFYLAANPEVARADVNPLVHFATHGLSEGRLPVPELEAGLAEQARRSLIHRALATRGARDPDRIDYARWIAELEPQPAGQNTGGQASMATGLATFGILVPQTPSVDGLTSLLLELMKQSYDGWTLLIPRPDALDLFETSRKNICENFDRVTFVDCEVGADRGAILDSLFQRSECRYVIVLDIDDTLAPSALMEFVDAIERSPEAALLYSDEDKLNYEGDRVDPQFKPSFSPQLLQSYNYFGRLTALSSEVVSRAGGFTAGDGAAAEWSLNLRMAARADARICRIPRVLCHRAPEAARDRFRPTSRAADDARKVLSTFWRSNGIADPVVVTQADGTHRATWRVDPQPLVSIIIPNRNQPDLLRRCTTGLLEETDYAAIEIIIVENNSTDPGTLQLYAELAQRENVHIVRVDTPFNYSQACNKGAELATGELLLFLNNDIEVVDAGWLNEMVRVATLPGVGIVGTKLSYPDGTLQHAGVAVGIHLYALMYNRADAGHWGIFGSADHPRNWLAIMGACQLIRRSVFDAVGRFDESYRIANSDVALCLRAHKAGWQIAYTPHAALLHHEGKTRGHSNPHEDMIRSAQEVRRLGIVEDPFLHPQLSPSSPVPGIRRPGEATLAENLVSTQQRFLDGLDARASEIDLADDHAICALTGLPHEAVLWAPQSAATIVDRRSAARFVIDVIRRRTDLKVLFPQALSGGSDSAFLDWLDSEGALEFSLSTVALGHIRDAFSGSLGEKARQIYLYRDDVKTEHPLGLLPEQRGGLLKWFLCSGRVDHALTLEDIWWLFLAASENPELELVRAYRFNPRWQQVHPLGLTMFGRERFAAWIVETYKIPSHAAWLRPERWPDELTPAQQLRLAYRTTALWQRAHPDALGRVDRASDLLRWLDSPASTLPKRLQRWCGDRLMDGTAATMVGDGINILAHFCFPSGLRVSAEAMRAAIEDAGVATSLRNVRTFMVDEPHHFAFGGREIYDVTVIHAQPEPFFDKIYTQCDLEPRRPRTHRIAYWYWELDRVPDYWKETAQQVDEIWTATEFVASALRAVVDRPVHTLFPGVRLGAFKRRSRREFGLPTREDGRFAFLFSFHMGSVFARKNPLGLIESFRKAFDPHEPVDLVLKTTTFGNHEPEIQRLRDAAGDANVHIVDKVLSNDEILSLTDACDAYASLHRSEGLGLTMAEAMLLGKPVIASRYSGNLDFMNEDNSLLVDCTVAPIMEPAPPYNIPGARWAMPDTDHAASHMRRIFDDEALRIALGANAKRDADRILSLNAAGRRFARRLQEIREQNG